MKIEEIARAAESGGLTIAKSTDVLTGEEVEILCFKTPQGLRPVARIYGQVGDAMADVRTPGGHHDHRVLH